MIILAVQAPAYDHDTSVAEEFRVRGGLPNFFAKIARGKDVRIAYFGGSITMADGWRVKTFAYFKSAFPAVNFIEINAAISGTGTDYGACRVGEHVVSQKPDLVFVEFRVNGGDRASAEGIVRQIWRNDPSADICFVYTINEQMVASASEGKTPPFGTVLESIANTYGIPSIDMGLEVVRQLQIGSLIFKADSAPAGKAIFAKDGTHPGDEGHSIYRDVIVRSFEAMRGTGKSGAHTMPSALEARPWESTYMMPITSARLSAEWTPVDRAKDSVFMKDSVRTTKMMPYAVKSGAKGASITVKFNGIRAGLIDIASPKETVLSAVVDGKVPVMISRKETFRKEQSAGRFFFIPDQEPGEHTVRFEIAEIADGVEYYVGPILVIGAASPMGKPVVVTVSDAGFSSTGSWNASSLKGANDSKSLYSFTPGATASWAVPASVTGRTRISFYRIHSPKEPNDQKMQIEVVTGGTSSKQVIDTSIGTESGWIDLGVFSLTGSGDKVVVTKTAGANTRVNAVKFESE
ncbi:MAG: hypothetical protein AABZ39_17155 [Spirochaetota bacterium]